MTFQYQAVLLGGGTTPSKEWYRNCLPMRVWYAMLSGKPNEPKEGRMEEGGLQVEDLNLFAFPRV